MADFPRLSELSPTSAQSDFHLEATTSLLISRSKLMNRSPIAQFSFINANHSPEMQSSIHRFDQNRPIETNTSSDESNGSPPPSFVPIPSHQNTFSPFKTPLFKLNNAQSRLAFSIDSPLSPNANFGSTLATPGKPRAWTSTIALDDISSTSTSPALTLKGMTFGNSQMSENSPNESIDSSWSASFKLSQSQSLKNAFATVKFSQNNTLSPNMFDSAGSGAHKPLTSLLLTPSTTKPLQLSSPFEEKWTLSPISPITQHSPAKTQLLELDEVPTLNIGRLVDLSASIENFSEDELTKTIRLEIQQDLSSLSQGFMISSASTANQSNEDTIELPSAATTCSQSDQTELQLQDVCRAIMRILTGVDAKNLEAWLMHVRPLFTLEDLIFVLDNQYGVVIPPQQLEQAIVNLLDNELVEQLELQAEQSTYFRASLDAFERVEAKIDSQTAN